MSILTDPLPKTLEISGKFYPIAHDFRTWILISELIEDPEMTDAEKLDTTAVLVFDGFPSDHGKNGLKPISRSYGSTDADVSCRMTGAGTADHQLMRSHLNMMPITYMQPLCPRITST